MMATMNMLSVCFKKGRKRTQVSHLIMRSYTHFPYLKCSLGSRVFFFSKRLESYKKGRNTCSKCFTTHQVVLRVQNLVMACQKHSVLLAFYVFLLKALQPIATSESRLQHKSMGYAEICQKRFISTAISSRPQMFVMTCFTMPCMNPTDDPAAHFHQSATTRLQYQPVIGWGRRDMQCTGWGGFFSLRT